MAEVQGVEVLMSHSSGCPYKNIFLEVVCWLLLLSINRLHHCHLLGFCQPIALEHFTIFVVCHNKWILPGNSWVSSYIMFPIN